jgi:hypothetical protein
MLSGSVFGKMASVDTVDLGRAKLRKASTAALSTLFSPKRLNLSTRPSCRVEAPVENRSDGQEALLGQWRSIKIAASCDGGPRHTVE